MKISTCGEIVSSVWLGGLGLGTSKKVCGTKDL